MELSITTFAKTYADPTTRQDLGIERFLLPSASGPAARPGAAQHRAAGTEVAPLVAQELAGTGR